jgi:serine phosphatase RsbU (regulator of sigma subunit)
LFHFDPVAGKVCAFDLANRSFTALDERFEGIGTFSLAQPLPTASLLAVSFSFLALGISIPKLAQRLEHIKIPFFVKLLIPFVCLLILTGKLVGAGAQKIMGEEIMSESLRRSANLAGAVLNSLSPADLKSIQAPEDREGLVYEKVYQSITRVLNREDVEQTPKWILHKIRDGRYYFGVNIWRGAIYAPYVVPQDRTMFFRVLQESIPQHGLFVDEQGEWLSYLAPVVDETGKVIYVLELYRPAEEMRRAGQQVSRKVNEVAGITVTATLMLLLVYSYIFTRPLRRLKRHTEIISSGNFEHSIDIRSRDELGDLARAFNTMVGDLKNYTREIARAAAEKEALAGELRLARQLQREMLPQALAPHPNTTHVSMFAEMEPAREVGGDYYDYFLVDENHLGVVVADVSGKGIPAALFMMRMRSMLRGSAAGNLSPADTLSRINQIVAPENSSAMFVTMFYFICHLESGRVAFCNAGHNPPLLVANDQVSTVGEDSSLGKGFPIGVMEEALYSDGHLQIHCGETLLLYSDGVTESCNPDGELFTEERLENMLGDLSGLEPKDLCLEILNQVRVHQGKARQADDITLLAFRLDKPRPHHKPLGWQPSISTAERT